MEFCELVVSGQYCYFILLEFIYSGMSSLVVEKGGIKKCLYNEIMVYNLRLSFTYEIQYRQRHYYVFLIFRLL